MTASGNSVQFIATINNILGQTVMHRLCGNAVSRFISLFSKSVLTLGSHDHKNMDATVHVVAQFNVLGLELWTQPCNVFKKCFGCFW